MPSSTLLTVPRPAMWHMPALNMLSPSDSNRAARSKWLKAFSSLCAHVMGVMEAMEICKELQLQ
jgi:hypothetical protein